MKLFEDYCISNNIELFWSTWDYSDAINYSNVNIRPIFIALGRLFYVDLCNDWLINFFAKY